MKCAKDKKQHEEQYDAQVQSGEAVQVPQYPSVGASRAPLRVVDGAS